MLDTLRKSSKSALIYVFFAIIIVVFVFSFGPGSNGCRSGSVSNTGVDAFAARVNGESIPLTDFQLTYARVYKDYQSRAGGAFTEDLARSIGLKGQVLDQMIDRELLAQAALDHGIAVSDKELSEDLAKTFAYQGKFDEDNYKLIVERQLGMTTWQYEDQERRRLAAQKMISTVAAGAKVADDEVRAEFIREKEKIDVAFVRFAPAAFKAEVTRPDDTEIASFIKGNTARIEEAYKTNSYRYHKPKRLNARHILVKVDDKATEAQAEAAKQRLVEVRAKIVAGADFAALAKEVSEDPSNKDKGGELPEFGPGTMDPLFEKAAFQLKEGELSEPVRSRYGWHLVKVDKVLPEENKALEAVQHDLALELLLGDKAKEVARKKAEETLAAVKSGKTLEELWPPEVKKDDEQQMLRFDTAGTRPAAATTGPFPPANDYVPKIGVDADLSRAVLTLEEKKPVADQVYEVNGSLFVVALKSHERPDFKEFEAKMDEYRDRARQRKAGEQLDSFVKALKEKAKIEKNEGLLVGSGRPTTTVVDDG
jgi:peptidyl-prolyl cis-trans isomerase D